jgi:hypothetical protein
MVDVIRVAASESVLATASRSVPVQQCEPCSQSILS